MMQQKVTWDYEFLRGIWPCQVPGRWWLSLDEIWKMRRSSFGECFLQRGKSMCKGLVTIKNITDSRIWKQANMTGVKRWRERAKQIVLESVSDFRESSGSLLSSVLCLGVQLSSEQSKITKLQIARRSASSFKTISGHYKEWFGREKKDIEERPAKRLLWRSWREAVGSDIRWYWCKQVEPDGAKSWDSARGCTTSESELRSCQVVGLDGWGDGQIQEWARFSRKTMHSISDMWNLRLLVYQDLSGFLFPEMVSFPQFLMWHSSSFMEAQLRCYYLPFPPIRQYSSFLLYYLYPGNCKSQFTSLYPLLSC